MRAGSISDDLKNQIIERRLAGQFQYAIAHELGVSVSTVNKYCKEAAKQGVFGVQPVLDGFEITKITTKTDDGYVTQRPEKDGDLVLPEGHILERTSLKVGDSWYKTKLSPSTLTRDDLLEIFAEYRGSSPAVLPPPASDLDLITVYTMSDLHLGMLAWGRETGVSWDLNIARHTIFRSMTELVQCSPTAHYAVLLDLGDYTHANDQKGVTPGSGHQLDVDGRFRKTAKEAIRLRMDLINLLASKHERVIIRSLPGNHDPDVSQILSAAFSIFFENNQRITVDDDPSEFWMQEFGVNMLAANHGHKTKPRDLPGLMAARWPTAWGRTKVRQAWSGHIHHTTAGEENGARWETLRTAAPGDSYSHSHGYTAGRELVSHTYHRDRGLRQRQVVQIL